MNLNKVFIIGRLTADPQLRSTASGQAVGTFSLATNRNWVGKDGQKKEEAQFHNVVVWGRQAEIAGQFLKKGSVALVEGRLQTRDWTDKQGQNRKTTEIVCERIQLGPRSGGGFSPQGKSGATEPKDEEVKESLPEINIDEEIKAEDVPF